MPRGPKTVHVATDVHKYLRIESIRLGISVQDLLDLMLREEINRSGGKTLEVAPVATRSRERTAPKKKR